jgi:hypothetical protein
MWKRALWVVLFVPLAIVWASGCTGAEDDERRDYSIPNPLCKIRLDSRLYEPVFPGGSEVDVYDEYLGLGGEILPSGECAVEVDGEPAIYIESRTTDQNLSWASEGRPSIEPYVNEYNDRNGERDPRNISDAERVSGFPHEAWVWNDLAVATMLCESSVNGFSAINVSIRLDWVNGGEDLSEPLKELIIPFAEEMVRSVGERACRPERSEP